MKFRESDKDVEKLTWGVVWEGQIFIIQEAIKLAGILPTRWEILISHLSSFPENAIDETLSHLELCLSQQTEEYGRLCVMSILAIKNIQMRTGHLNLSLWKK